MQGVPAVAEKLGEDVARIPALLLDVGSNGGHRGRLPAQDRLEQPLEESVVDATQDTGRLPVRNLARAEGGELVEQGDRVAHRAVAGPGDQAQGRVADLDLLGVADLAQVRGELARVDPTKAVLLAAGEDGRRHRLHFGGGEDEDQVGRRLLDDLEQRVEGLPRQAVDLVDHHHLVAVPGRAVLEALGQLAHLLHLGVGGGVHLDDVEVGALGDLAAGQALVAGVGGGTLLAVERLGQDAGDAGLAHAADAREEVRLGDPPLGEGVAERGDDRLLSDDAGEILGSPLAGEDLVGHLER